jgi:hypothetical protein
MNYINKIQQEFYEVMTNARAAANSRAAAMTSAAAEPRDNTIITEMINGVLVSRPAKKYTKLDPSSSMNNNKEPLIIELGGSNNDSKSKAGSIYGNIGKNKIKAIHDFMTSKGLLV